MYVCPSDSGLSMRAGRKIFIRSARELTSPPTFKIMAPLLCVVHSTCSSPDPLLASSCFRDVNGNGWKERKWERVGGGMLINLDVLGGPHWDILGSH